MLFPLRPGRRHRNTQLTSRCAPAAAFSFRKNTLMQLRLKLRASFLIHQHQKKRRRDCDRPKPYQIVLLHRSISQKTITLRLSEHASYRNPPEKGGRNQGLKPHRIIPPSTGAVDIRSTRLLTCSREPQLTPLSRTLSELHSKTLQIGMGPHAMGAFVLTRVPFDIERIAVLRCTLINGVRRLHSLACL